MGVPHKVLGPATWRVGDGSSTFCESFLIIFFLGPTKLHKIFILITPGTLSPWEVSGFFLFGGQGMGWEAVRGPGRPKCYPVNFLVTTSQGRGNGTWKELKWVGGGHNVRRAPFIRRI